MAASKWSHWFGALDGVAAFVRVQDRSDGRHQFLLMGEVAYAEQRQIRAEHAELLAGEIRAKGLSVLTQPGVAAKLRAGGAVPRVEATVGKGGGNVGAQLLEDPRDFFERLIEAPPLDAPPPDLLVALENG